MYGRSKGVALSTYVHEHPSGDFRAMTDRTTLGKEWRGEGAKKRVEGRLGGRQGRRKEARMGGRKGERKEGRQEGRQV